MDLDTTSMSVPTQRASGNSPLVQSWGWKNPIKWLNVQFLRYRGWKCEGPFPKAHHEALLIFGPRLDEGSPHALFVEHRLQFAGAWLQESMLLAGASSFADQPVLFIDHRSEELSGALKLAASQGILVQIIRASVSEKRIRCNTPFRPGKFLERDLAYLHRMFSYRD